MNNNLSIYVIMHDLMELWPGFCAGMAQAIIGHPLDTIKKESKMKSLFMSGN